MLLWRRHCGAGRCGYNQLGGQISDAVGAGRGRRLKSIVDGYAASGKYSAETIHEDVRSQLKAASATAINISDSIMEDWRPCRISLLRRFSGDDDGGTEPVWNSMAVLMTVMA